MYHEKINMAKLCNKRNDGLKTSTHPALQPSTFHRREKYTVCLPGVMLLYCCQCYKYPNRRKQSRFSTACLSGALVVMVSMSVVILSFGWLPGTWEIELEVSVQWHCRWTLPENASFCLSHWRVPSWRDVWSVYVACVRPHWTVLINKKK